MSSLKKGIRGDKAFFMSYIVKNLFLSCTSTSTAYAEYEYGFKNISVFQSELTNRKGNIFWT
jgi:hypothetical protein